MEYFCWAIGLGFDLANTRIWLGSLSHQIVAESFLLVLGAVTLTYCLKKLTVEMISS